jgi:SulP family sulfate permease
VGGENILPHVEAALERARQINADFGGVGHELAAEMERRSL